HPPEKLREVKRHVVEDLLRLHDRRVTYTLLAAVALAVLMRFAGDAYGQFALWLVGLTGSGKSTLARLFQSFFCRFPASMGLASWISTPNFLERQGYFFANAIYAVDDYKPGVCKREHVVRILQANADRNFRGRLRSDATPNTCRWSRGLMLCTGEDVPEHSA